MTKWSGGCEACGEDRPPVEERDGVLICDACVVVWDRLDSWVAKQAEKAVAS